MCECACGDIVPTRIIKIGDIILVVELYPGCESCKTPLATNIYFFSDQAANELEYVPEKILELNTKGFASEHFFLFGTEELIAAAKTIESRSEGGDVLASYDSFTAFLTDYGTKLLQEALRANRKS